MLDDLLRDVAARAARYQATITERAVAPTPQALAALEQLGGPLPAEPTAPAEVLALLDDIGSPATVATTGSRYFGFVIGGTLPAALAANWLAGAWDQNAFSWMMSPVAATLETITLNWLLDLLHLPPDCAGAFVTGATMANFSALAAARHRVLRQAGWDVEAQGLFGAPPITVVVGAEAHASVFKALGLLGFGRERVVRVPVDGQGRMLAAALPEMAGPTIVCVQAGNVNTGAFDPAAVIDRAHAAGAWVHVDGAFGLWAAAAPAWAYLMAGYERADSWATDAHKWLNVPYDSGLAFVHDAEALRAAMAMTAAYLPQSAQREPGQYTPESSRRARGIEIWAALRSLGREGVADLIEQDCQLATQFAVGLQAAGIPVLNDVVLNQVLVDFGDQARNDQMIAALQADGTGWFGPTVWQGHPAMRISVSSWATSAADVERSLAAIIRIAAHLENEPGG